MKDDFSHVKISRSLIASHNKLQSLDDGLFTGQQIEYLDLSYNQFTNVKSFGRAEANGLK